MDKESRYDKHRFDRYLRPLGNPWVIGPISILLLIIGVVISIRQNDWEWLSRMGSLITIVGLLLTMSPMFIRGIYKSQAHAFNFSEEDEEGNNQSTDQEDRRIGNAVFMGVIITILGALINTFGEFTGVLINNLRNLI